MVDWVEFFSDPIWILLGLASIVATLIFLISKYRETNEKDGRRERGRPVPINREGGGAAMVAGGRRVRAARNRMAAARRPEESEEEADDEGAEEGDEKADKQVKGTKKLKKLQEKAEKKAQREAELQEREERKKREALQEEERKKEEARQEAEEQARIEEEKRKKEEEERREHEEYLKLKEAFIVEEEGTEGNEDQDAETLLQEFINHIKEKKVVILEDLASQFRLKTQECIERVQALINEGKLTGVIDDRGKFIYITMEELEAVAKFIRQRGRVSITELAESSNKLIRLNPETVQQKETPVSS